MKKTLFLLLAAIGLGFLATSDVAAQGFVSEQRSIRAYGDALYELLGDDLYGNHPLETARALFNMPVEELLSKQDVGVEVIDATWYMNDNLVRMGEGEDYYLLDLNTGIVQLVNTAERTYAEWNPAEFEGMQSDLMDQMGIDPDEFDEYADENYEDEDYDEESGEDSDEITEAIGSGHTKELYGRTVTSYEVANYDMVTVTWCSADDADLINILKQFYDANPMLADESDSGDDGCENGLPIREQTFDMMSMTYEISDMVSFSKESVSADLFRIPDGFKKVEFGF